MKRNNKAPITQEKIFKFMFFLTIAVSAIFFLKNLLGGAIPEAMMIGGTISVFGLLFVVLILGLMIIGVSNILKKITYYSDGHFKDQYLLDVLNELEYLSE